jgi:hypothetical protein
MFCAYFNKRNLLELLCSAGGVGQTLSTLLEDKTRFLFNCRVIAVWMLQSRNWLGVSVVWGREIVANVQFEIEQEFGIYVSFRKST